MMLFRRLLLDNREVLAAPALVEPMEMRILVIIKKMKMIRQSLVQRDRRLKK
jgi:hypothetical protein